MGYNLVETKINNIKIEYFADSKSYGTSTNMHCRRVNVNHARFQIKTK
jgi:DNA topoisomerase IB